MRVVSLPARHHHSPPTVPLQRLGRARRRLGRARQVARQHLLAGDDLVGPALAVRLLHRSPRVQPRRVLGLRALAAQARPHRLHRHRRRLGLRCFFRLRLRCGHRHLPSGKESKQNIKIMQASVPILPADGSIRALRGRGLFLLGAVHAGVQRNSS